jgi:integrase/recombinase XerC
MLDRFAVEYQEYHGLTEGRKTEQLNVLRQLQEHAEKDAHDCTASDVKAFLSSLIDADQHPNTVRKKLGMVKPYFAWAWEAKLIDAEAFMEIQRVRNPRGSSANGLPKPYTRKDLARFRSELDARWPEVDDKFWRRWRKGTSPFRKIQPHAQRIQIECIVALALNCGLRREEIYRLSVDDMHYDNAYVVVRKGKGGKYREVPHTEASREAVRRWLELRNEFKPDHDQVWLSLAWKGIESQPMRWDRFRKILRTVGDWQLHRFRHTCGTEWLRAIKRIEIVSRLLGHSRVQQTLGYAAIVRDDLHDAVAKAEGEFARAIA